MDRLTFIFGAGAGGGSAKDAARRSKRSFVRSEAELAIYDETRKPTGHILTAWEAFTSFGLDVLEEAAEYGSAILRRTKNSTGNALKQRREELDLPHSSVGKAAEIPEAEVKTAESLPAQVSLTQLEHLAFALGLDERLLAFKQDYRGDTQLAYRLRTLVSEQAQGAGRISKKTALLFAEAASIIRVQRRLHEWLGLQDERSRFIPYEDYGSSMKPAWQIGYRLAEDARRTLNLGESPIASMRELVEERLGIPVIQAQLPKVVAGATVMTADEDGNEARGVVLNTVGENENVWIRRATLAHELGHLLYDPDSRLQRLRVDSYADNQKDPQTQAIDFVEQRANAFAIAFLAPNEAMRHLAPTPISEEAVSKVIRKFGISHTAARYHIANSHYRQFDTPSRVLDAMPSDEQKAAENFAVDYFPLSETPIQRRGRFCGLVTACYERRFISEDTAALYLRCSGQDFQNSLMHLRTLYQV